MAIERTLSIIKPDAVAKNVIGEIYSRFEKAGLSIVAAKRFPFGDLVTHSFRLNQIEEAYDLFAHQRDGVMKVAIRP